MQERQGQSHSESCEQQTEEFVKRMARPRQQILAWLSRTAILQLRFKEGDLKEHLASGDAVSLQREGCNVTDSVHIRVACAQVAVHLRSGVPTSRSFQQSSHFQIEAKGQQSNSAEPPEGRKNWVQCLCSMARQHHIILQAA